MTNIFKNRRGTSAKSPGNASSQANPVAGTSSAQADIRSVSFDPSAGCVNFATHYCDTSEDILR